MRGLVVWIVVFACLFIFTFFVDLGGNFFGLPDGLVQLGFAANLTLFLWLLAKFVGRPMAAFLDTRAEGIRDQLKQAQKKLAEAEELRAEVRKRLDDMEQEVAQLRERASREADNEMKEIAKQTAAESERFLKRVDDEIARRQAEARQNLARETATLTAQLTKELLERELTDQDRRRILDRSLAALRAAEED
jgi:F-type H+-transporting ATPase subunit b